MLSGAKAAEVSPGTRVGVKQGQHQMMVPAACSLASRGGYEVMSSLSPQSAPPQAQFLESPACFLIIMNNSWPDDLFMSQTSFVRSSFDFYKWSSFNLLAILFSAVVLKNDPNGWLLKVNWNFILLFQIQNSLLKMSLAHHRWLFLKFTNNLSFSLLVFCSFLWLSLYLSSLSLFFFFP